MKEWLLILSLFGDTPTQIGPFETEHACQNALTQYIKHYYSKINPGDWSGPKLEIIVGVCVKTTDD